MTIKKDFERQTKVSIDECRELIALDDSRVYDRFTPSMVRGLGQRVIDLETVARTNETSMREMLTEIEADAKAFREISRMCDEQTKSLAAMRIELEQLRIAVREAAAASS